MTTNAATDTTNVIPMVRTATTPSVTQEKGAIHVFSGENGENEQSGTDREVIGDFLEDGLVNILAEIEAQQKATNITCRALIKVIMCHPDTARTLRSMILEANGDKDRYVSGVQAILSFFDAGQNVQSTALCKQSSTKSELLSEEFQTKKIKPFIEDHNILIKKADNSFRWATLEELQELAKPANDLRMEDDHLQMTCNSPAIGSGTPANGLRLLGNRLAVNPLARVRHWQRDRAMQMALADPWKKVTASGAVEVIHNPYDLKATGPRTEKEKELIRKATIVEAEAQLKFKIAAAGDKQRMQDIQRASLDADAQAQAIINEGKIKLAQMQHERLMRRERLATYKTPLILAGLVAAVLFVVANNNGAGMGNNNDYPVELANMPLPAVGNGE